MIEKIIHIYLGGIGVALPVIFLYLIYTGGVVGKLFSLILGIVIMIIGTIVLALLWPLCVISMFDRWNASFRPIHAHPQPPPLPDQFEDYQDDGLIRSTGRPLEIR